MPTTKIKRKTIRLKLTLPDSLAREAEARGLLTSEVLEELIRAEVKRRRVDQLFEAADRLAVVPLPPLTDLEIEAEIQAVRARKRALDASSS